MVNVKLLMDGDLISRVAFDYRVSLLTEGGVELTLAATFQVSAPGGRVIIDPQTAAAGATSLLSLLHVAVTSARAENTGRLKISFDNGAEIQIDPDDDFEAWTVAGPNGFKVVCLPGGGLANWEPE